MMQHYREQNQHQWSNYTQVGSTTLSTIACQSSSPCHWWGWEACPDRLLAAGSWACRWQAPTFWSPPGSWPGQGRSSPSGSLPTRHIQNLKKKTKECPLKDDFVLVSCPDLLRWLRWCTGTVSWKPWLHPLPWNKLLHRSTPSEWGCSAAPEHRGSMMVCEDVAVIKGYIVLLLTHLIFICFAN